jgi:tetratricopeptide (TPR) repeat protein
MLKKFMRKQEIEEALEGKGEFIQINLLETYLKQMPPMEMRKFAHLKLAEIYHNKKMFDKEADSYKKAGINSSTFREKQKNYLAEAKAHIFAGKLELSDKALKKAMDEGNSREKKEIYEEILEVYRNQIKDLEIHNKKDKAQKLYEKLIRMKIDDSEKEELRLKLMDLYERLGKTEEHKLLKEGKII